MKKLKIDYRFFLELQKGAFGRVGNHSVPISSVLELMILSRGDSVATVESMAGALVTIIYELDHVKSILERDIHGMEHELENQLTMDMEELKEGFAQSMQQSMQLAMAENLT